MPDPINNRSSRRRLLVINPNTDRAVTERIRDVSERSVFPGTEVVVVNPATGPRAIESPAERDAAVPGVLSLIEASRADGFDGYVLACFDDIGLPEARDMVGVPVVGTCEAGIATARALARRFTIVTTVFAAVPTINGLIDRYGVRDICTVRAAGIGVAAAAGGGAAAEEKLKATIRLAIEEDGAEAILLGSGGLTGRARALANAFSCPIVDGVAAAVKMAEGLATLGLGTNRMNARSAAADRATLG